MVYSLTYKNLWEGDIDDLGFHVFEYIKQVGLGNNQAVLRDDRNRVIACMDGGRPSFEDVLSSHEFVCVESKHSKVNIFVLWNTVKTLMNKYTMDYNQSNLVICHYYTADNSLLLCTYI